MGATSGEASRWRAWAGIAGPVAFIATWSVLGTVRAGYSAVQDPISRLAAVGAPTRPVMTAGFVAFAAGVGLYSSVLREQDLGDASLAAKITAAAALVIAALPLGGPAGNVPHAVAAVVAYAALAAMPLLAARPLAAQGDGRAAVASIVAGAAIAAALAISVVGSDGTGLAQRVGLTVGDLWIMASALRSLRARSRIASSMRSPSRRSRTRTKPGSSSPRYRCARTS